MNKVLLIGGGLFVGKAILEQLESDYEVTLLNLGNHPNYNHHQLVCDRLDLVQMKTVLENQVFDYVIDVSVLNLEQMTILTKTLDFCSVKKYVMISSSAVYDVDSFKGPYKETDALCENHFWTQYGKDKIEAETYARNFFQTQKTDLIILRPPYLYGESNYVAREAFIFRHLEEDKPICVPKSNNQLQFLYALDLGKIVKKLLEQDLAKETILNVGNKESFSMVEWIQKIGVAIGKEPLIVMVDYQGNVRDFFPFYPYDNVLSVDKLIDLGFVETPFDKGIKNSYAWYQKNSNQVRFRENAFEVERELLFELIR